jgi:hypothetical protein
VITTESGNCVLLLSVTDVDLVLENFERRFQMKSSINLQTGKIGSKIIPNLPNVKIGRGGGGTQDSIYSC